MKHFFIFLMTAGAGLLYGQGYRAIDTQRAYVFSYNRVGANYDIAGFKVDSTKSVGSRTFHYFNQDYERNSYLCYSLAPVWIGPKYVSADATLEDIFYNKDGEAITIQRNASLGQEWICYSSPSISVAAKVARVDYQNHLEGYDSVKTISFKVYSLAAIALNYQLNDLSIKIGKKKGLVQAINFKNFPGGLASETATLKTYTIMGATKPLAGIPPMSKSSIYDYAIGDELHTQEVKYALPAIGSYYDTINTISKVISRIESTDSITLLFKEQKQFIKASDDPAGKKHEVSYATSQSSLRFSKYDYLLPGSSKVENGKLLFYTQSYSNGASKLIETSPGYGNISGTEFCINHLFCETSDEINYYLNGFGGPYFDLPRCYISYWGWSKKLIYAKKGEVFFNGTPFNFGDLVTDLSEPMHPYGLQTSPNPFAEELTLDNTETLTDLSISDLQGNIHLHEARISTGTHTLKTSQLPQGIYILSFTDVWGQKRYRKLLKN